MPVLGKCIEVSGHQARLTHSDFHSSIFIEHLHYSRPCARDCGLTEVLASLQHSRSSLSGYARWGVDKETDQYGLRGPGWLSGGRASQAVGITCTEVKRQRPAGCIQGMGLLSAIPYHHMLLRMEAHAKEGRDKKWKMLWVPIDTLELPHQPWRGYAQTSWKHGKRNISPFCYLGFIHQSVTLTPFPEFLLWMT